LRHVNGYVEMLRERAEGCLDPASRRYLDLIQQSAAKLGDLIDHFLAFAHMGRTALNISTVDMNLLVRQALEALQPETEGRQIEWQIADLPKVQADPDMMRQVWVNLLSNAVKYTRDRDQARIEVGFECPRPKDYLFYVRDNGVGFDMRYAAKLFGVFQRLHPENQFTGTGIGLANVRRIVKRHGGQTYAEGTVNAGAKVSFTLRKPSDHVTETK
jgi:light-regulated signal transduction histidine kinase (bacteriophytochrome)